MVGLSMLEQVITFMKMNYHSKNTLEVRVPKQGNSIRVRYEIDLDQFLKCFKLEKEELENFIKLHDCLTLMSGEQISDGKDYLVYEGPWNIAEAKSLRKSQKRRKNEIQA